jgi:hypothetical protein
MLNVLAQIRDINRQLTAFASGPFAITDAFAKLTVTFDEKGVFAECFYKALQGGDLKAMEQLAKKLKGELTAVEEADKALASYLQSQSKT